MHLLCITCLLRIERDTGHISRKILFTIVPEIRGPGYCLKGSEKEVISQ